MQHARYSRRALMLVQRTFCHAHLASGDHGLVGRPRAEAGGGRCSIAGKPRTGGRRVQRGARSAACTSSARCRRSTCTARSCATSCSSARPRRPCSSRCASPACCTFSSLTRARRAAQRPAALSGDRAAQHAPLLSCAWQQQAYAQEQDSHRMRQAEARKGGLQATVAA